LHIPEAFTTHTGLITAVRTGYRGENSETALLTAERGRFMVKRYLDGRLEADLRVLGALRDQQPFVPAILTTADDVALFPYLDGADLVDATCAATPAERHRLMAEYALALRQIHSWTPNLPPLSPVVADRIRAAGFTPTVTFCHGDYCMPNALVTDGRITGIIDWSSGGYHDYRVDLAAGAWSIRYNLHDEAYVDTFLRTYGYAGSLDLFEQLWEEI
jgi:aminoglycoside phosphotransferase